MKTISAREAKDAFDLMIDIAGEEPVLIETFGSGSLAAGKRRDPGFAPRRSRFRSVLGP